MSVWWKKLVAALSSGESNPFVQEDSGTGLGDGSDAAIQQVRTAASEPIGDTNLKQDTPEEEAFQRIADPISRIEQLLVEQDTRSNQIAATVDRLAGAVDSLTASRETGQHVIQALVEKTESARVHAQQLREIVATLPEIAHTQVEAISAMDQRLEAVHANTVAVAEAAAQTARDFEQIQAQLAELHQAVAGCRQADADLDAHQRQIAKALNVLRQKLAETAEVNQAHRARLQQIADGLHARHQAMHDHVTQQGDRVAARVTTALIFSAIAAVAAITAAILTLTRVMPSK